MSAELPTAVVVLLVACGGLGGLLGVNRLVYGADADWWNPVRKLVWPRIHGYLSQFGGYSLGAVHQNQYVGRVKLAPDELERTLLDMGFTRNPWAALKRRFKGMDASEGSWVYRDSGRWYVPDWLASMQLHVTVFETEDGFDVYAHWEDNYWVKPGKHLDETNFSARTGVDKATKHLSYARVSLHRVGHPPEHPPDADSTSED